MNNVFNRCKVQQLAPPHAKLLRPAALLALLLASHPPLSAAPGAHGPNGEHLDAPTGVSAATRQPRMETKTEQFELVATLSGSELSVLIDRFESNEPVLGAELDVESGGLKARAKFHADHGDYAVDDAAFLKKLAQPGEHALVFTLKAGTDSDLLDGTLVSVAAAAAANGHGHAGNPDDHGHDPALERKAWAGAGAAALVLVAAGAWWRRRRRQARKLQGGL